MQVNVIKKRYLLHSNRRQARNMGKTIKRNGSQIERNK